MMSCVTVDSVTWHESSMRLHCSSATVPQCLVTAWCLLSALHCRNWSPLPCICTATPASNIPPVQTLHSEHHQTPLTDMSGGVVIRHLLSWSWCCVTGVMSESLGWHCSSVVRQRAVWGWGGSRRADGERNVVRVIQQQQQQQSLSRTLGLGSYNTSNTL